jgi:phosphoribosyl-AMP cyclohydrolase
MSSNALIENVTFGPDGLVAVLAQDHETGEVLMLAYMNEETLRRTLETNVMTYWSRSRQAVWVKGQSSGHTQEVREIRIDCDGDALLFKVRQRGGAACHTGFKSCFHRRYDGGALVVEAERIFEPEKVYGRKAVGTSSR